MNLLFINIINQFRKICMCSSFLTQRVPNANTYVLWIPQPRNAEWNLTWMWGRSRPLIYESLWAHRIFLLYNLALYQQQTATSILRLRPTFFSLWRVFFWKLLPLTLYMVFKIKTFSKKFVWLIDFAFLTLIRAKISTIEGIANLSFIWKIDKLVCSWNAQVMRTKVEEDPTDLQPKVGGEKSTRKNAERLPIRGLIVLF